MYGVFDILHKKPRWFGVWLALPHPQLLLERGVGPCGPRFGMAKLRVSRRARRRAQSRTLSAPQLCWHVPQVLPEAAQRGFRLVDPFPGWPRRGRPVVPGAERLVRVDPDLDGTDGFFVALFERIEEDGEEEGGHQGAAVEAELERAAGAAAGALRKAGLPASGRAGKGGLRLLAPAGTKPALDAKAKHRKLKGLRAGSSEAGAGMQAKAKRRRNPV